MPPDSYSLPQVASLYDALNPAAADTTFYLDLAGSDPCRVLDIGCGTGLLACALAARGHTLTGVDPAPAMLAVARTRPGAERVCWVEGVPADLPDEPWFDLAVMTGHVFQVFLDEAQVLGVLNAVRRRLVPGGRIAFETRNPLSRPWRSWTPDASRRTVAVDGIGPVTVWHDLVAVEEGLAPLVTHETHFVFPGAATVVTSDRLRFFGREAVERLLRQAGFRDVAVYGDWDHCAFARDAREIIVVAA